MKKIPKMSVLLSPLKTIPWKYYFFLCVLGIKLGIKINNKRRIVHLKDTDDLSEVQAGVLTVDLVFLSLFPDTRRM